MKLWELYYNNYLCLLRMLYYFDVDIDEQERMSYSEFERYLEKISEKENTK